MIQSIPDSFESNVFNRAATHPLQSWEWGEARKRTGVEVFRFGEYDQGNLQQVFTITLHALPYTRFNIGYVPRSVWPSEAMMDHIAAWAIEKQLIFIKWEPDETRMTDQNALLDHSQKPSTHELVPSKHPLFPKFTQTLDLTTSEDELLKKMKPKTRYNIRLAQKKGVVIKELSTDEGFEIFATLYFETCRRQHYHGHTFAYHKTIWETLNKGIAHILIAFAGDEPLAAYELFHFHDKLYYPYGGSSERNRNLMAPNLLMWEAIRLGKSLGAHTFDMWGSLPPEKVMDNTDSHVKDGWQGFSRFKEGYGTTYLEFAGSYDMIISPLYYSVYSLLYKLRTFFI